MTIEQPDRRAAPRVVLAGHHVQASVLISGDDRFEIPCSLLDISTSGALVDCEELRDELYLELDARLRHGGCTVPCRLIRVDRTRVGVRFTGEPADIRRFVDTAVASTASPTLGAPPCRADSSLAGS